MTIWGVDWERILLGSGRKITFVSKCLSSALYLHLVRFKDTMSRHDGSNVVAVAKAYL